MPLWLSLFQHIMVFRSKNVCIIVCLLKNVLKCITWNSIFKLNSKYQKINNNKHTDLVNKRPVSQYFWSLKFFNSYDLEEYLEGNTIGAVYSRNWIGFKRVCHFCHLPDQDIITGSLKRKFSACRHSPYLHCPDNSFFCWIWESKPWVSSILHYVGVYTGLMTALASSHDSVQA